MNDDIIETMPWNCGEKDCAQQWHKRQYWIYQDGTYSVDEYADGNHEDCEQSDVPSHEEVRAAWAEYSRFCVETGTDPLSEFIVQHQIKRMERWIGLFVDSIGGVRCNGFHRNGQRFSPQATPQYVREFFQLEPSGIFRWYMRGMGDKVAEVATRLSETPQERVSFTLPRNSRAYMRITATLEHNIPRSEQSIARDIKRLARRHLKEKQP